MCGRYTLSTLDKEFAAWFGLDDVPPLRPRYNIVPTQTVAAVRFDPEAGRRRSDLLRWGLIPPWAKDAGIGPK